MCSDLTGPGPNGDIVVSVTSPSVDLTVGAAVLIVGDTIRPTVNITMGGTPTPRARFMVRSLNNRTNVVTFDSTGTVINVVGRGADTLVVSVVGATINPDLSNRTADTVPIVAKPFSNILNIDTAKTTLESINETALLRAVSTGKNGEAVAGASVVWSSSDSATVDIASTTIGGTDSSVVTITAKRPGSATITAVFEGVDTRTQLITVAPTVASYRFSVAPGAAPGTPAGPAITQYTFKSKGEVVRIVPRPLDALGSPVSGAPAAVFTTNASAAVLSLDPNTGVATAVDNTTTPVTIGVVGFEQTLAIVIKQEAKNITIQGPRTVDIAAPTLEATLTAIARDSLGNTLPTSTTETNWNSSVQSVATIDENGKISTHVKGTSVIDVRRDGATDAITLNVGQDPKTLTLTPKPMALVAVGATAQATARTFDAAGAELTGEAMTWTSTNAGVASVSTAGVVTANAVGTARVVATTTVGAATDTLTVNVTNNPTAVSIIPSTVTLASIGDTLVPPVDFRNALNASLPRNAVIWEVRTPDPGVARVSLDGLGGIIAQTKGETQVIARSADGAADTVGVIVTNAPATVVLNRTNDQLTALQQTLQYSADVFNARGALILGAQLVAEPVTFRSTNAAVASVNTAGLVTALSVGTTSIIAEIGGSTTGLRADTATLTVSNSAVAASVTPANASITSVGSTLPLSATATNNAGGVVSGQGFNWSTSDASVATVSATGVVTAVGTGTVTITASVPSSSVSATSTITVTNLPTTIAILSADTTLASANDFFTPSVDFKNAAGTTLPITSATWTSDDPLIATVTSAGLITAKAAGTTKIRATNASNAAIRDSIIVTVSNAAASVTLTPGAAQTLTSVGQTLNLSTAVLNQAGQPISNPTVTFTVITGSSVSVTTTGVGTAIVTALSNGVAQVRATSGTVADTIDITVAQAISSSQSTVTASAPSMVANGSSTVTITVQLKDGNANNYVASNPAMVISPSAGTLGPITNNTNGNYTATLTAPTSTAAGSSIVTVTAGTVSLTNTAIVTLIPGTATQYLVTSSNLTPVAGAPVTISAQLKDANGNNVSASGITVNWTSTGGGSFSPATSSTTSASGLATITFTTASTIAPHTVMADDGTLSGTTATITPVAGTAAKYFVSPATTTTVAGTSVTMTAQLTDANGNTKAQGGVGIVWGQTGSAGTFGATTATNSSGIATITFTTPVTAGASTTISATGTSITAGNTATVSVVPATPVASAATAVTSTSFTANWGATNGASSYRLDVATDVAFSSILGSFDNLTVAGVSQSVTGLTAGTTYYFRVRGANGVDVSASSNVISVTTLTAPTAIAASAIAATSFTANWNSLTGATSYRLDVSTDNFSTFVAGFSDLTVGSTSQSVSGLAPATTYQYRVRAIIGGQASASSPTVSVTTLPDAPTANAASAVSAAGFTANWSATATATSYRLDIATDAGFTSFVSGYNDLGVGAATSAIVTGLTSGTTYYYRVRAVNGSGTGASSNTVTVLVLSAAPSANAASAISETGFTASWNAVAGAASYELQVSTDNTFAGSFVAGYNPKAVAGTSDAVTGLAGGTTYYSRVRAINATGSSAYSNTVSALTIPAAPAAPAASAITTSGFTASWSASTGATSYRLDVSTSNTFASFVAGYQDLTVNVTSQPVTGLSAGTTYYFRVRAVNATGASANSGQVTLVTASAAPVAIAATSVTTTGFDANWNTTAGATVGYRLDVATDAAFTGLVLTDQAVAAPTTTFSVTGLTAGTTYYYRVRAENGSGSGPNSNTISQITVPGTSVAIAATSLAATSFTANWNATTGASSYRLDVSTDPGFGSFVADYNNRTVSGTSDAVTGLTAGTTYHYRVRAVNAAGTGASSNTVAALTVPAAPVAAAATTVTTSGFTANWAAATGAADYRLDVSTASDFSSFVATYNNKTVAGTSDAVAGLSAGTTYYYRVRAVNASGTSANSGTITTSTQTAAPVANAPFLVGSSGFTANWNAVAGATSYRLDVSTDAVFGVGNFVAGYEDLSVAAGNSQSVTGLTANTQYYYRVRAVTAGGASGNSNTIDVITLGTPVAAAATGATTTSLTANWNAFTDASSYRLDVSTVSNFASFIAGYQNKSVTGTSDAVTGLTAGTTYHYRVRAIVAGVATSSSNTISQITIADAPVATAATAVTATSFTANWNASTGAASYRLDVSDDNFATTLAGFTNLAVAGTSQSVTGLTAGTTYKYRVRAVNAGGTSANSNEITQITVAGAPVAIAATGVTTTSFTANWNALAGATSYRLDVSDDNFATTLAGYTDLTVAGTSQSVTGLTAGTTYKYRVRGVNAGGTSANSNEITQITVSPAPVAIAATAVSATGFTANWNATTGAASYRLDVSDDDFATTLAGFSDLTVAGTSQSVTGLTGGTTYKYRVRAVNAGGTSANSNEITQLTISAAPVAIAATAVTATSFTANWNATTGAASYRLDVSDDNFATTLAGFTDLTVAGTSQSVTGLTANTTYKYRVRAVNASGTSANSNEVTQLTLTDAPVAIAASAVTTTSFTANWNAATGATGYRLDVSDDNFATTLAGFTNLAVAGTSQSVTGLTAGTTYKYRVRAENGGGTSANSNEITQITVTLAPVAAAATTVTATSFTANWGAATGAASYRLDVSADNFATNLAGFDDLTVAGTSQSVTGLTANTTYKYRVRAVNAGGASANSNEITQLTATDAPVAIAATTVTETSFTANWNATTGATGYRLDVSDDNFATTLAGFTNLAVAGTSQSVTGLTANTTYKYRVRAENAGGTSVNSNEITQLTATADPVAIAATAVTSTGFTANWNATTGATSYRLDVSDDNFATTLAGYTDLTVAGTSQVVAGLSENATYKYRVRAVNAGGTSGNSNEISQLTAPAAPTGLDAAGTETSDGFTASWAAATGADHYEIEVASDIGFNTIVFSDNNVAATSKAVSGLSANTQYWIRVRAVNANGHSSPNSGSATVTTLVFLAGMTIPTLQN